MPNCFVSFTGSDGTIRIEEVDADSLFEAADGHEPRFQNVVVGLNQVDYRQEWRSRVQSAAEQDDRVAEWEGEAFQLIVPPLRSAFARRTARNPFREAKNEWRTDDFKPRNHSS